MKAIYQTVITQIGSMATDALEEGMMITFKEGAPQELADYCFIHHVEINEQEISAESQLWLNEKCYPITAIGDVAALNLRELGHLTIRFDAAKIAELPGSIHVIGTTPQDLAIGSTIKFTQSKD